jgi:transaldolase/glucose-6-phosphate isomerase
MLPAARAERAREGRVSAVTDINSMRWTGPDALRRGVETAAAAWDAADSTRRLWARDATLWTDGDEARWLGWLDGVAAGRRLLPSLAAIAADVREAGFTHALLLGMGGSSLCPEVLAATFGHARGFPPVRVLDSTDPGQALAVEGQIDLARTLVIVASKSGTTLEPHVFMRYVFERLAGAVGRDRAGRQFVAITDPGSALERSARADGFRHVVLGEPSIGGRYSALSPFGLVPAAVMGLDVASLLDAADRMVAACRPGSAAATNPGVLLGLVLGTLARAGRDKLTIVASPGVAALGAWLEQLVAESTGKNGRAIIPVDLEPLAAPDRYGDDRVFAYLRDGAEPDPAQEAAVAAFERAGHPVVHVEARSLTQELFRWEVATAVAGALLGINPFDQPDVEASKVATRALTTAFERDGRLPAETPLASAEGVTLFADPANAEALASLAGGSRSPDALVAAHLSRLGPRDYCALLAYVEMNARNTGVLQAMRARILDRRRVATCLGFGPRFLHSTGQAYKGGPASGVFLQVTCDDARDVAVPGQRYSFGVVKAAQARGDFAVLAERGRRALRVHLGPDVPSGLQQLARMVNDALGPAAG